MQLLRVINASHALVLDTRLLAMRDIIHQALQAAQTAQRLQG